MSVMSDLRPFGVTLILECRKSLVVTGLGNTGMREFSRPMFCQKPLYKRSGMRPCIIDRGGPPTPMLVFDDSPLLNHVHVVFKVTVSSPYTCFRIA
ncbi:hypothetical protein AVEN_62622-1 [Araneus ventricosus]|uniref:Uncharacterized protein n=1 Tax=Araneus ventricosus TaxID=182803 RepID=A0A4Y2NKQ0_ARAVE|nr:hypothetical protein AVEN_62622-1 [Araneus ventricosus]